MQSSQAPAVGLDTESIIESKSFWALGNFSRFIRPGYVRVDLKGDQHAFDGLLGSAYRDPKSGKLMLVYINLGTEPQKVTWKFTAKAPQAAPASFIPYVTNETEDLKPHPAVSAKDTAEIPPRAVVTFVSGK